MIIMGVDPGSRVTGYGLITSEGNRLQCLAFGAISVVAGSNLPKMPGRLRQIHQELSGLIERYSPEIVVVEGVFYAANVKSALTLGHVRGVILLAAAQFGVPIVEYSPLEVKKAVVGYGRADKEQVQLMVQRLLNLSREPEPHDASDALAVAICQAFNGGNSRRKQKRWRAVKVKNRKILP